MISLLLQESEAKPRTSVNNKDIIRMHLGLTGLFSKRLYQCKQWLLVMFTYQSFLCIINSIDDILLSFFSLVISTYHPRRISRYRPVVSDIRFITLQISLMYGFTGK